MSDSQVLHFFGGKGGAGKTTLSTAFALNLSEKFGKDKLLLASFEPSGGLSDLLKKRLGAKPTKIATGKGVGGVFAAEIDQVALAAPLEKLYRGALKAMATKGALLSQD